MTIPIDSLPTINANIYENARKLIQSGDLLLCSGQSVFAKMIQLATGSIWSHVAFILRLDVIDRIMVLESVESVGVRAVPLSNYVRNYNGSGKGYAGDLLIARHSKFDLNNIKNLSKNAVDLLGYPYDTDQILRIVARISFANLSLNQESDLLDKNNAYICSEYAYHCYESVGINFDYSSGYIAPSDFAKNRFVEPITLIEKY